MQNELYPLKGRHLAPDPINASRVFRRRDAAIYVRETWGFPCSPAWLAKLAVVGGGPFFRKAGRFPIYAREDLDSWASSRFSPRVKSTSEL